MTDRNTDALITNLRSHLEATEEFAIRTEANRWLGGRGLTFYGERVTEHLSPQAADQTPMTLFAFGKADTAAPHC